MEVEITYREDATVPEDLTPENYILEDRGTLNPDFGEIKIADVSVNGQTVTLTIDDDTQATEKNDLVYTGDDAGVRERNAFGVYCTGAWYRCGRHHLLWQVGLRRVQGQYYRNGLSGPSIPGAETPPH